MMPDHLSLPDFWREHRKRRDNGRDAVAPYLWRKIHLEVAAQGCHEGQDSGVGLHDTISKDA